MKRFKSYDQGIRATAETLMNGRYQDILDGLQSGDPYHSNIGAGLQVWVSGKPDGNPGYAQKVLGGRASSGASPSPALAPRPGQAPSVPSPDDGDWAWTMNFVFGKKDPAFAELMASIPPTYYQDEGPARSLRPDDLPAVEGEIGSVVQAASTQLGKPYVFGSGPDTKSFDCSDLIQWAYHQVGINLPRTTYNQINSGVSVKGKKLKPGDLIFPTRHHVVMYVGGGKVIAAPHTGTVVQYQDVPTNVVDVRRVTR